MSLAILGGTFDPIHLGHLLIAEQVYNKFKIDRIIFMFAGSPPHKKDSNISADYVRLEMVKKAVSDNPHFIYSDWELKKNGVSYTVDTLDHFMYRGFTDIYFIIGADSLLDMHNWKRPQYLLGHANFIVAKRSNYPVETITKNNFYKPYLDNIYFIDNVRVDISSTEIRDMIKRNHSIRYLVPDEVLKYINRNNLYHDRGE